MLHFPVRILKDYCARPMLHDLSSCGLRNGAHPGTGSCLSKCFGFHVRSSTAMSRSWSSICSGRGQPPTQVCSAQQCLRSGKKVRRPLREDRRSWWLLDLDGRGLLRLGLGLGDVDGQDAILRFGADGRRIDAIREREGAGKASIEAFDLMGLSLFCSSFCRRSPLNERMPLFTLTTTSSFFTAGRVARIRYSFSVSLMSTEGAHSMLCSPGSGKRPNRLGKRLNMSSILAKGSQRIKLMVSSLT